MDGRPVDGRPVDGRPVDGRLGEGRVDGLLGEDGRVDGRLDGRLGDGRLIDGERPAEGRLPPPRLIPPPPRLIPPPPPRLIPPPLPPPPRPRWACDSSPTHMLVATKQTMQNPILVRCAILLPLQIFVFRNGFYFRRTTISSTLGSNCPSRTRLIFSQV
ncbi:MAG TPA: hypothetical protein EYG03_27460 [Planctomycetes bacterium]|nr:hypothetical protein [Fuerstiella sp.]HIK95702.1 hypothetical protein [Planctomycetota bacterium]